MSECVRACVCACAYVRETFYFYATKKHSLSVYYRYAVYMTYVLPCHCDLSRGTKIPHCHGGSQP